MRSLTFDGIIDCGPDDIPSVMRRDAEPSSKRRHACEEACNRFQSESRLGRLVITTSRISGGRLSSETARGCLASDMLAKVVDVGKWLEKRIVDVECGNARLLKRFLHTHDCVDSVCYLRANLPQSRSHATLVILRQ